MMTTQITVQDVLAHHPCEAYRDGDSPTARLISLVGAGLPATAETVEYLRSHGVPNADIVWAACRVLDPAIRASWLERIVTRAVETHALHCGVPAVETLARAWLSGEDRSAELALWASSAAAAAAAEARWSAAAARAAARGAAARAAAREAAAASVSATMAAAAWAAAADEAAAAAERAQQVDDLIAVLAA